MSFSRVRPQANDVVLTDPGMDFRRTTVPPFYPPFFSSEACADLLALERVPHWDDGHVEDIRNLREHLQPAGFWEDVSPGRAIMCA
jgi:hypothetical protein